MNSKAVPSEERQVLKMSSIQGIEVLAHLPEVGRVATELDSCDVFDWDLNLEFCVWEHEQVLGISSELNELCGFALFFI